MTEEINITRYQVIPEQACKIIRPHQVTRVPRKLPQV